MPLRAFRSSKTAFGRLPVDEYLKVKGLRAEFAAGDAAWLHIDGFLGHVLSTRPAMGRFAGHNALCDLLGEPMSPLRIDWCVTVLDLAARRVGRGLYRRLGSSRGV